MNVLVVVAHPDDEVLGCGGTIARHAAEGDGVHILIVAEGATSRDAEGEDDVARLGDCARAAAEVLKAKPPLLSGFPDNRLDSMDRLDVIREIERHVAKIQPDTVYTHHGGDLNIDHRIVHEAVITACRPLPGSSVRRILSFEAVSSTEWATPAIGLPFRPTYHVDISTYLPTKLAALECYGPEMRPFPHPRSTQAVEALARLRGSQVGLMAAEAFQSERELR
ncbi:MAG: PIG-L family deacetylase [Rhodospirillales bacterium]|nr:PIG-L family deacetylase [Rhodospirillales bacterium]